VITHHPGSGWTAAAALASLAWSVGGWLWNWWLLRDVQRFNRTNARHHLPYLAPTVPPVTRLAHADQIRAGHPAARRSIHAAHRWTFHIYLPVLAVLSSASLLLAFWQLWEGDVR